MPHIDHILFIGYDIGYGYGYGYGYGDGYGYVWKFRRLSADNPQDNAYIGNTRELPLWQLPGSL